MQKYQNNVTSLNGNAVANATVTVMDLNGTNATLYSDNDGTATANPMLTDSKGQFAFYAADGRYNIAINGIITYTDVMLLDGVELGADAVKKPDLAATDGATKVGTPEGTVQFALDGRPTATALAGGTVEIGFLQAGIGAVLRPQASKSQDTMSVFDFMTTAEISDVKSGLATLDHTAAVQKAINASYGKRLLWPYGAYNCGPLVANKAFCWRAELQGLNPYSYATKVAKVIFLNLVPAGQAGLTIAGGVTPVSGISMEGFAFFGNLGIDCLNNGGALTGALTDASFKDILIYGFRTAINQSYVYDSTYTNVRAQSCINGALNGNQTNGVLFSRCAFVSGSGKALEHINCEGIHYDTCDVANQTQVTSPVTLFQSAVTFTNPYFENIDAAAGITVGTNSSEAFPSSLQVLNPVKFGRNILAGKGVVVDVSGVVRQGINIVSTSLTTPYAYGRCSGLSRDAEPKTNRLVRSVACSENPRFTAYVGGVLSYVANRGYTTVANSAGAGSGVYLALSSLTVGALYTLHLAARIGAGGVTSGPSLRHGSPLVTSTITLDAAGATPTVRKYSFIATDAHLILMFSGEIDFFGFFIEEGNESDPLLNLFATSAVDAYVGEASAGLAPTVGTWRVGDVLSYVGTTIVSPVTRRRCTVAGTPGTWAATGWQPYKGTTAQRPTLGAGDIGVTYLDTTLVAAGKPITWAGAAWVDATGATV